MSRKTTPCLPACTQLFISDKQNFLPLTIKWCRQVKWLIYNVMVRLRFYIFWKCHTKPWKCLFSSSLPSISSLLALSAQTPPHYLCQMHIVMSYNGHRNDCVGMSSVRNISVLNMSTPKWTSLYTNHDRLQLSISVCCWSACQHAWGCSGK